MTRRLETILSAYPTHLSVSDLATVLGVTMKTTYEYLQAGDIPAYRVVRKWVILRDDVRDFLERSSVYRPTLGETAAAASQQAARALAAAGAAQGATGARPPQSSQNYTTAIQQSNAMRNGSMQGGASQGIPARSTFDPRQ